MKRIDTDVLVIGSGIAGLFYAIKCAEFASVVVVTKSGIGDSNTLYAQGGIAAVTHRHDSIEAHIRDTLAAGDGLCNEETVRLVATAAPDCIRELEDLSVNFDRNADGDFDLHREGGHSHSRVLHTKDATGREVENSLVKHLRALPRVQVFEHHMVLDLLSSDNQCQGACVLDCEHNEQISISSSITMLASGGASCIFEHNTNPPIATGDGLAIAHRAGVELRDLEFVQFHPTALVSKQKQTFLISEAVRGFGAVLRNAQGEEFMRHYHPMAHLAPRDVVSKAISTELEKSGDPCVYLDLRHCDIVDFRKHFPTIAARCDEEGIDVAHDMIPVTPAAHYFCGGVATDLHARTSLARLYACGEVACTGLHGANRLASNSLLEGLVFAREAALDAKVVLKNTRTAFNNSCVEQQISSTSDLDRSLTRHQLQSLMWHKAGIRRTATSLQEANTQLLEIQARIVDEIKGNGICAEIAELNNMCCVSLLLVQAAQGRKHSVGCHWRLDE